MKKAGSRVFNPASKVNGRIKSYIQKIDEAKLHRPPDLLLIAKYQKELDRLNNQKQKKLRRDSFGNTYYP